MKKQIVILTLLLSVFAAQSALAQLSAWDDISVTEIGREQPRTRTLVYASPGQAFGKTLSASDYIQPLSGDWKIKTVRTGRQAERELSHSDGWATAQIPESTPRKAGVTMYQKEYKLPFAWIDKLLMLNVGSVNSPYSIYVNGDFVAYNQSGRVAAEFDLTRVSLEGNNILTIVVYGDSPLKKLESHSPTGETQITGDLYIMAQPKVRVRDFVAETAIEGGNGLLNLGIIMKSHMLNPKQLMVYYDLYDADGNKISTARREARFEMKLEDTVRFFVNVPLVRPWSHESPNLYTLQVRTMHEGRDSEYVSFRFGFRSVDVLQGQLYINNWPTPLLTEYYKPVHGNPDMEKELRAIKARGVNSIKVMNYPADERFFELCDIIGLYVCNQADINTGASGTDIRKGGNPSNDPAYMAAFQDRVMGMYHTSKTHPSAVLFSLAEKSANGINLYQSYIDLKNIEQSRPVIYTDASRQWNSDASADGSDMKIAFPVTSRTRLVDPEPITYAVENAANGMFRIYNNSHVTPVHTLEYTIMRGKTKVASGTFSTQIPPQGSALVKVPLRRVKLNNNNMKVEFYQPTSDKTYMQKLEAQ